DRQRPVPLPGSRLRKMERVRLVERSRLFCEHVTVPARLLQRVALLAARACAQGVEPVREPEEPRPAPAGLARGARRASVLTRRPARDRRADRTTTRPPRPRARVRTRRTRGPAPDRRPRARREPRAAAPGAPTAARAATGTGRAETARAGHRTRAGRATRARAVATRSRGPPRRPLSRPRVGATARPTGRTRAAPPSPRGRGRARPPARSLRSRLPNDHD